MTPRQDDLIERLAHSDPGVQAYLASPIGRLMIDQSGSVVETEPMEPFVLDRDDNPHPDMLDLVLRARRIARMVPQKSSMYVALYLYWQGCLDTMAAATGERREAIIEWMDAHDTEAPFIASPEGQSVNIAPR